MLLQYFAGHLPLRFFCTGFCLKPPHEGNTTSSDTETPQNLFTSRLVLVSRSTTAIQFTSTSAKTGGESVLRLCVKLFFIRSVRVFRSPLPWEPSWQRAIVYFGCELRGRTVVFYSRGHNFQYYKQPPKVSNRTRISFPFCKATGLANSIPTAWVRRLSCAIRLSTAMGSTWHSMPIAILSTKCSFMPTCTIIYIWRPTSLLYSCVDHGGESL